MTNSDPFAHSELDRFLRDAEVEARTGIRATRRAELEELGLFPRRVPIGARAVAWSERELVAWQKQRLALRDDAAAAAQAKRERTPQAVVRECRQPVEADAPA
jgi:predicted DNA-binding transcriptional regulator AlpA